MILFGAQSCGFGPVSKACAVARELPAHERAFVGDAFASAFARSNDGVFDSVHEVVRPDEVDALLAGADWVISVMSADLVLMAVAAGRPVTMVDSLFSFWQHERPLEEIAALVATAPRSDYVDLKEHFAALHPHEEILAAHMLAGSSLLQNFPGVPERVAAVEQLCDSAFRVTGSIVDWSGLSGLTDGPGAEPFDAVINVGGFKNFFLDFDTNNSYLPLIEGWVHHLLEDRPELERVLVCGGAYRGDRSTTMSVGGRTATFDCLPQRAFMGAVASTTHYLMTPGLTALHEAMLIERLPLAMPEQHYGHVVNMRRLDGTTFHRLGTSLDVPGLAYPLVEDDFEGTRCIAEKAGALLADPAALSRFHDGLDAAVDRYAGMSVAERSAATEELRPLLDGEPITAALTSLRDLMQVGDA